jgi:hypothetical protein
METEKPIYIFETKDLLPEHNYIALQELKMLLIFVMISIIIASVLLSSAMIVFIHWLRY